ncbi:MAG: RNA methyltransferase [Proteobacteria bacterium]|nr:RNA methyltransferase [Pseudomonadota bacterium]
MKTVLDKIKIILVGTLAPGNVGSVARAMKNMGIARLCLVSPQCTLNEEAFRMATSAENILQAAQTADTLREAIADAGYVFGTTARARRLRPCILPQQMGEKIAELIPNNQVALVFGPEDRGLSNEHLELCNEIVSIPTARGGKSLNLSHAVIIMCYEVYRAVQGWVSYETPRLSPAGEVENMYDHMRSALLEIGYLDKQNPDITLGSFRGILTRAGLTRDEVKLIRGVFRQLLWYIKKKT